MSTDLHDSENYFDKLANRLAEGMSSDSTATTPEPTLSDRLDELAQKWEDADVDGIIRAFRAYVAIGCEKEALEELNQ